MESVDPYEGWCGDGSESDCSTLLSDGHLQPSSDEEAGFDEDGNFRSIEDDLSIMGQVDCSCTGEDVEPPEAYFDFVAAKRRKTTE